MHWARPAGVALAVGAVGLGLSIALIGIRTPVNDALDPGLAWLLLVSTVLMLLGLPAMSAAQADASGTLGVAAHVLLEVGLLLFVLLAGLPIADPRFSGPYAENGAFFLFGISLTLGLLATSIVTLRAGVLPRTGGVLMLVATVGFFFTFFVAETLPAAAMHLGTVAFAVVLSLGFVRAGLALTTIGAAAQAG